jgi:hypothetical protein
VIDVILYAIFGRTFLWGCVVPDWRDEVCTAVERWIEVVGVSGAGERGGRPKLKLIGRARRESVSGWYAVDVRDQRIDPDQIDNLRLAGASQPGPGEGFSRWRWSRTAACCGSGWLRSSTCARRTCGRTADRRAFW